MSGFVLLRRLLVGCGLGVVAGCGITDSAGQRYAIAHLEGVVREASSGAPVANAQVYADLYDFEGGACNYDEPGAPNTAFDHTDRQGRYRVEVRDLLAGERCLNVRVRPPTRELRDTTVAGPRLMVRIPRRGESVDVVRMDVVLMRRSTPG